MKPGSRMCSEMSLQTCLRGAGAVHSGVIKFVNVILVLILLSGLPTRAAEPLPLPVSTPWDVAALSKTPTHKWLKEDSPVKSLTYRGLSYKGKPTSVFAYYASPTSFGIKADKSGKFPTLVLVHGGGGKAFSQWVELWAKRGYAAIAMDHSGRGPDGKRLPDGGPEQGHEQKFATIDEPLENQWSYHAVANVLLAHSLVRSFEEVDIERTGVTGISWGGYLTCIVAGVDARFKFAMPVYGCGFLRDNSAWRNSEFGKMSAAQSDKWHKLWDPSQYLASARMPVAFLNGTNDFAYPMDSYAKSCALVRTEKNYSIQLKMRHGHLFDFPEFFVFADQYLKKGVPMPVVSRPALKDGKISTKVVASTKILTARLHFTTGPHKKNSTRPWTTRDLSLADNRIEGDGPPDDATAYYVEVTDERKAVASSEVMTR
ncbi:acetylxylan esterase [Akkermansiaceae bacterium]|nr:acetylxylan esterase [Akkermansiaceae bacterium]